MKKKLRIVIFVMLLLVFLPITASALDSELYAKQYEDSGADKMYDALPEQSQDIFDKLNISAGDDEWLKDFSPQNIFSMIWEFLKAGGKQPFSVLACLVGIILLCAAADSIGDFTLQKSGMADYISALAVAAVALVPVYRVIEACVAAVKANGVFMLSFVPVYTGILVVNGQSASAAGSGALLLLAAEATVSIVAFVIMPLAGCYLAVCICTGVSPMFNKSQIAGLIQKISTWVLGLTLTVFIGILGVQTTIGSAADSVGVKAVKFAVGSAVPVVGPSISEALGTVQTCINLLKSSVGIYGVIAVTVILIPIILELVLWRFSLFAAQMAAALFGRTLISGILKAVDGMLAVLLGIMLFCAMIFIISLTILIKAGG